MNSRAAAIDANRRGISLHEEGRIAEAVDAFRKGIELQPSFTELHTNLATALMRLGRFDEARTAYERVLTIEPDDTRAHLAMYELEQIAGNNAKAIEHQARVLARRTLFSEIAPAQERSIIVLMAPGDWQANVPIDFLVNRRTTTLHKLFVIDQRQIAGARFPRADVVVTAIAESDANTERLLLAQTIVERLALPVVNPPLHVLNTNRVRVWELLSGIENVSIPKTQRIGGDRLCSESAEFDYPVVIRPVGSHAGHDLQRMENPRDVETYAQDVDAEAYYLMPFVDFSKDDGYYRKYRIIVVDGVPYAYHLAISPRWMIHYYNAPMREHAWMREEEKRFLTQFESVFTQPLQQALRDVANALGLEYVGLDCSIDRQGRLLVFEADPAMIVHAGDDPATFGYKIPAAQRIFDAFERLLDRARSR